MTYPSNVSLEALWDGDIKDVITKVTASEGSADAYGEKAKTWSAGSTTNGRVKVLKPTEVSKEFGYLQPGDAIALIKNSFSVAQGDRLRNNSIDYEVVGIAQKKTHQEIALKRLP